MAVPCGRLGGGHDGGYQTDVNCRRGSSVGSGIGHRWRCRVLWRSQVAAWTGERWLSRARTETLGGRTARRKRSCGHDEALSLVKRLSMPLRAGGAIGVFSSVAVSSRRADADGNDQTARVVYKAERGRHCRRRRMMMGRLNLPISSHCARVAAIGQSCMVCSSLAVPSISPCTGVLPSHRAAHYPLPSRVPAGSRPRRAIESAPRPQTAPTTSTHGHSRVGPIGDGQACALLLSA